MSKAEFLSRLNLQLSQLPASERQKHTDYYAELIDDMTESGIAEETAVAKLGDPKKLAKDILTDTPLPLLVKTKVRPSGGWSALAIILLVLTFPIWFSIGLLLLGALLIVYICLWSVVVIFAAAVLGLIFGGLALAIASCFAIPASPWTAICFIGIGLGCIGVGSLLCFGVYYIGIGIAKLTKLIAKGIKSLFIRKDKREAK